MRRRPGRTPARTALTALAVLVAATGLGACSDDGGAEDFVTRLGTSFELAGKPFRFVGANLYDAAATDAYSCSPDTRLSDKRLRAAMTYLRDDAGATVVRFWAYQTYTAGGKDFTGIDRVIGAARSAGLRVIPVLDDGPGQVLLTVTDLGFGKRTDVDEYRQTNRGGSGVVNCKITSRNGKVASLIGVAEDDHIMVVTDKGIMIRMVANSIRSTGRSSQGVRVIALGSGERVTSVTRLEDKDESLLTAPVALDEAELKAIEAEDAQALPEEPEDEAPPADDEPVGE